MTRKRIGIGNEGLMHKQFAGIVRQYEGYGKLNSVVWSYFPSGEKRSAITGGLLKAKGLAKGIPDYFFIQNNNGIAKIVYIEFKAGKGKQSESQTDFEKSVAGIDNIKYYVCRSVEEAIKVLEMEEMIIK